jgi:hypothetical protein
MSFNLEEAQSCSEIPACRRPEVLSILVETGPRQKFCGNFADGIKKDVKDVMDADERRNKIKYVSTACLAGIRPSLRHSV